eukprot:1149495-Pelagomonas_calceolata.AAC.3
MSAASLLLCTSSLAASPRPPWGATGPTSASAAAGAMTLARDEVLLLDPATASEGLASWPAAMLGTEPLPRPPADHIPPCMPCMQVRVVCVCVYGRARAP